MTLIPPPKNVSRLPLGSLGGRVLIITLRLKRVLGSAVYSKSCRKRAFFRECVFVGCVFIISIIREDIQSFQAHINYFCSSVSLTEM